VGRLTLVDLDKTISFIRQNGKPLDLLRLRRALKESFTIDEAEDILSSYQFPDGSWDYKSSEEDPDRIGSLGGTIHCLRWLREFALGTNTQMTHTLKFLTTSQASNGSFYETEAKLAHSPQKWLKEETLVDRFYFTTAVPMRLFSLGYQEHPIIEPALKWLERHWTDWELVAGTWYGPWALLCISSAANGLNVSLYRRCYEYSLNWLPQLEAQPLTWLLDALHGADISAEEPLVKEGIIHLLTLQDEDGTWPDPRYSTVETTITALRLLQDYRSLTVQKGIS